MCVLAAYSQRCTFAHVGVAYSGDGQSIGLLNPSKTGFFLPLKGLVTPQTHVLSHMAYYSSVGVQILTDEPSRSSNRSTRKRVLFGLPETPDNVTEYRPRVPREPSPIEEDLEANIQPSGTELSTESIATEASKSKLLKLAYLWHERLGHISLSLLKKTARITNGIPNFNSIKESDFTCLACDRGKAIRRLNSKPIDDPPAALDSLEADTFAIKPMPYNKAPIGLFIIDRKSRHRWVFLLKDKSGQRVFETAKGFIKGLKTQFGRYPKRFHYDGGKEVNSLFQNWLTGKGIYFSSSCPYIHEQNGLIERSIRVLLDRLRATMLAAQLPLYLWNFIILAVLELVNSTAATNRDLTPYQDLYNDLDPTKNHKPDLKKYKVIGAPCEAFIPQERRSKGHKLEARTETGRLLAVLGPNVYLVYIPTRHVVYKTSILKLYEDQIPKLQLIPTIRQDNKVLEGENARDNNNPTQNVIESPLFPKSHRDSRPIPEGVSFPEQENPDLQLPTGFEPTMDQPSLSTCSPEPSISLPEPPIVKPHQPTDIDYPMENPLTTLMTPWT